VTTLFLDSFEFDNDFYNYKIEKGFKTICCFLTK